MRNTKEKFICADFLLIQTIDQRKDYEESTRLLSRHIDRFIQGPIAGTTMGSEEL